MSKKVFLLISFVVVLCLVGSAAADKTWTGSVDANWFNADNWSPAGVPAGGYDPCSGDIVHINGKYNDANVTNFPVINTTDPCGWCRKLWLGSEPNSGDAYLTIEDGGELTVHSYDDGIGNQTFVLGLKTGTEGILTMTGGIVNMTAGEEFEIGGRNCDANGTFDMTGGSFIDGEFRLAGYANTGIATLNVWGGVIDCNEFQWSPDPKTGTLNVYSGGTLICDYLGFLSGGYCNLYGGVIDSNDFKMWNNFGLFDIYDGIWINRSQKLDIYRSSIDVRYYVQIWQIAAYGGRGEVGIECFPYEPNLPEDDWPGFRVFAIFDPNAAYWPDPENGFAGASPEQTLSWYPAYNGNAVFHDIYFGEEFNDVNNAIVSDPCGVYVGRQEANSIARTDYWPTPLVMGNTYFWRIDEVNESDPCSPWKGPVWSFRFSYVGIDDFESYKNSDELDDVWKDYDTQTDPKTWCYVFLETDPAKVMDSQSMKLACLNPFEPYYGEVRHHFVEDVNWSPAATDARLLAFSVYGKASNPPDYIYVRLEDSLGNDAVQRLTDANAIQVEEWTELLFALDEFTSPDVVDLSKVKKITIGVGPEPPCGPGLGLVYIWVDNVRLYLPGCYPVYLRATGDINADCITDFDDLEQMALQWLSDEPDVEVDFYLDGCIDFKDFAILGETWLQQFLFGE